MRSRSAYESYHIYRRIRSRSAPATVGSPPQTSPLNRLTEKSCRWERPTAGQAAAYAQQLVAGIRLFPQIITTTVLGDNDAVHKRCCKAVSVSVSFAHRPTLQTTEGNSRTCVGWIFVIHTLFLEQSVVVCITASTSQLAATAKMWPRCLPLRSW